MLNQRYNIATTFSPDEKEWFNFPMAAEIELLNLIGFTGQTVGFFDSPAGVAQPAAAVVLDLAACLCKGPREKTLKLVLTHDWYDATARGGKVTEYREITANWTARIWEAREALSHVTFYRAYASDRPSLTRRILTIDRGPCPIPGWDHEYYRITFEGVPA